MESTKETEPVMSTQSAQSTIETLSRAKLDELERKVEQLTRALRKYVHCPHACIDCPCTKEARAALYDAG
jgi:hypothetical protein